MRCEPHWGKERVLAKQLAEVRVLQAERAVKANSPGQEHAWQFKKQQNEPVEGRECSREVVRKWTMSLSHRALQGPWLVFSDDLLQCSEQWWYHLTYFTETGCTKNSMDEGKGRSRRAVRADGESDGGSKWRRWEGIWFWIYYEVEPLTNTSFKNTFHFTVVHRHQVTEFNTAKIRITDHLNVSILCMAEIITF